MISDAELAHIEAADPPTIEQVSSLPSEIRRLRRALARCAGHLSDATDQLAEERSHAAPEVEFWYSQVRAARAQIGEGTD